MNSRICCFGVLVRLLALLVVAVCFEIVLSVGLVFGFIVVCWVCAC